MIDIGTIENELNLLKKEFEHGSFEYRDHTEKFTSIKNRHFNPIKQKDKYGVYIIRQKETNEILYIGKGGTIKSEGVFAPQDIPTRLKNVRNGGAKANDWFRDLVLDRSALLIEYIFLPKTKSPAFVEAALIQAFLNEFHHLPYKNKSL